MNRIATKFNELRIAGKKAFIPYIMGGDPDLVNTELLLNLLAGAGADFIEVGVPFSDPLADGAVIQQAGTRALANGCSMEKLFLALRNVNRTLSTPIILMIYYNMIFQRGFERFFEDIQTSGCAGLIIPDLPPEEAVKVREMANRYEIGLNFLVALTSPEQRLIQAAEVSTGFLYAVSLKGVTGARANLPPELPDFVKKIKANTNKPVAVGFGISTPEQAKGIAAIADGVIIGSAIVKAAASDPSFAAVRELACKMREAI